VLTRQFLRVTVNATIAETVAERLEQRWTVVRPDARRGS
jgi:hypothetical protein